MVRQAYEEDDGDKERLGNNEFAGRGGLGCKWGPYGSPDPFPQKGKTKSLPKWGDKRSAIDIATVPPK